MKVDEAWIQDDFNLFGLDEIVEDYRENIDIILSRNGCDASSCDENTSLLYGLIHARFLLTIWYVSSLASICFFIYLERGLEKMYTRYKHRTFGVCPRYYCEMSPVLPIGTFHFF